MDDEDCYGNKANFTLDFEIRLLPRLIRLKLGQKVNYQSWEKVFGLIPGEPWKPDQPLPDQCKNYRYNNNDIRLVFDYYKDKECNGFEALVEEWGTSGRIRPTINTLIELLERAQLNVVAECIRREVLRVPTEDVHEKDFQEFEQIYKAEFAPKISPFLGPESNTKEFPYILLKKITHNFNEEPCVNDNDPSGILGSGAYGVVYKAEYFEESQKKRFAIKCLKDIYLSQKQFINEINALSTCNHENILPLEGYSADGPTQCLIYTLMPNGSLRDRLSLLNDTPPLDWKLRLDIAVGTAAGLEYLHFFFDKPLVHRDVKTANILLDQDFVPKIGDFGIAKMGATGTNNESRVETANLMGTSVYAAPEALRYDVNAKMDVYSFGVVLLELLTGWAPFERERDDQDLITYYDSLSVKMDQNEMLDKKAGSWDLNIAMKIFEIAGKCLERKKISRLQSNKVLESLKLLI